MKLLAINFFLIVLLLIKITQNLFEKIKGFLLSYLLDFACLLVFHKI